MGLALTRFSQLLWRSVNASLLGFLLHGGMWLFFIAELGIVIWLSASIQKISAQAATIGFLVYSALNGVTMSGHLRLLHYGFDLVDLLITAMTFGGRERFTVG